MVEILFPGVYLEELPVHPRAIEGISTSIAAFLGAARRDLQPALVSSFVEFERAVGSDASRFLALAVRGFFENGGQRCYVTLSAATDPIGAGLEMLAGVQFSILCCPDEHQWPDAAAKMVARCEQRKDLFCILQSQPPPVPAESHTPSVRSSYAAYYYPWLVVSGRDGQASVTIPPCGHVAGAYARTDVEQGVHHAPAGIRLLGVERLSDEINPAELESLAARGINVLRTLPLQGTVIWSARTTSEDPDWQYVNVRRLSIFIEQSIVRGVQWAVFDPNSAAASVAVTRTIEHFLWGLWKAGALAGERAEDAFFVRCDRTTMTQADIDSGTVVVIVGVAPIRPAEFVVFRISGVASNSAAARA